MSEDWFNVQNEPIRKLKKRTLKLAISRRIRDDKGLTIVTVEGIQQGGKSTYAMRALMDMYGNNKDVILNQIVMSADGFKNKIQDALHGNYREIAVVWDDLSVEGSASTWMTAPMMVKKLAGLGDTLGIATKAFFMTSPSGDMIKAFRNYNKYKVLISNGRHEYDRIARGYRIGKSPMGQKWCSLEFEDYYDVRIPFYDEYYKMRQALSIKAVQEFNTDNEQKEEYHKPTKTEQTMELVRDFKAGVYEKYDTLKEFSKFTQKKYNIKYQALCNVSGLV